MNFIITLKDPDGVYDSLTDQCLLEADKLKLTGTTRQDFIDNKYQEYEELVEPYVAYGEYVDILVDTETGVLKLLRKWKKE